MLHDEGDFQEITGGTPMGRTPIILIRRQLSLGLIKDLHNHAKKGGAARSQTQDIWLTMPVLFPSCSFAISKVFGQ